MINKASQTPSPLRTYVLLHTYLKSLLNGVQGAHAVAEMLVQNPEVDCFAQTWARKDKTLVFLDGGVSLHMHQALCWCKGLEDTSLSWACFREDEATLEGLLTAIAITLPESVAKASAEDFERACMANEGPLWDQLEQLGVTLSNQTAVFSLLQWLRSRPVAA